MWMEPKGEDGGYRGERGLVKKYKSKCHIGVYNNRAMEKRV